MSFKSCDLPKWRFTVLHKKSEWIYQLGSLEDEAIRSNSLLPPWSLEDEAIRSNSLLPGSLEDEAIRSNSFYLGVL